MSERIERVKEQLEFLALMIPAELAVGDRVEEIYANTTGTVTGFVGRDEVEVSWDDPAPEDNEVGNFSRAELIKLQG